MTLEAQLLQIIEQQQKQLESALERLEIQALTIEQLKKYNNVLEQRVNLVVEENNSLVRTIQKLQNPQLSQSLLESLENSLKQQLESHLEHLVTGLNIESQAKTLIRNSLPNMVQAEIESQLKPLTEQVVQRMISVEQYQQKLAELIQKVSSQL